MKQNNEKPYIRSVCKKGSSMVIGIPIEIVRKMEITEDDYFFVHIVEEMLILEKAKTGLTEKEQKQMMNFRQKDKTENSESNQTEESTAEDDNMKEINRILDNDILDQLEQ